MTIGAIAATIAALSIIIVVHELGHFAVAKAFRIPVEEFAVGFGRPILAWFRRGETLYTLRPFLIGGFVRITGMDPDSKAENGFDKRPLGQRMAVVAAGSTMNLIVALIVFIAMGLTVGKLVAANVIDQVIEKTPAARADLRPGDRILAVNDVSGSWNEIRNEIRAHPDEQVRIRLEREGRPRLIRIVPQATNENEQHGSLLRPKFREITVGQIGIIPQSTREPVGLGESVEDGAKQALAVVVGLYWTITGQLPVPLKDAIGGPVRVVGFMVEGWKGGLVWFIGMAAMFSFQIGLINLLPIPPLDGSRAVFLMIEGVRRRPLLDKRQEAMVHVVGFMLLIAAVLLLTYHDILFFTNKQ